MADVDATLKIKSDSKKSGLTLGHLRKLIEAAEGKDDDAPVRVTVGWKSQIREIRVG